MNEIAAPALLGLSTGARASLAVAGIAAGIRRPGDPVGTALLRHRWGRLAAVALVAGELVGDKLPQSPSRLEPTGIGVRVALGALGGAALPVPRQGGRLLGAVTGAAGAVVGAVAGYRWRMFVAGRGWPDLPAALAEDAVAVTATWYAARRG